MRQRMPSLNLLHAFERAAHHRSFKLAAEELHVTASAISHKIKQLEDELGISLFHRITRAVKLTPAGQSFYKDVQRAFARLEMGTRMLHDRYGRQVLRLYLPPFFASEVLVPKLHSFQARHPDVDLHLESAFGHTEVHPEEADVSIALGTGKWPGMVCAELLRLELMAVCAPTLAEKLNPDRPEEVMQHTLISYASKLDAWQQWARGLGLKNFKPISTLVVDSMFSALQAAEQGLGVVPAVLPITQGRLNNSVLVSPFSEKVSIPDRYHVVYRKADEDRPTIQKFQNWVVGEFTKDESS
jgi:LysR family glycine cleavage system transcriptional activator